MDGNAVLAIRLHEGLSQREFAEKIGISPKTLSAIETGKRPVTRHTRTRIALHYDVTGDEVQEAIRRAKMSERLYS
ncbi:helix-turn-helix transcriptional regulator [Paenibacillus sp. S-12]|uniref:helix-turn-helix transcriptional regulator n=1 Tax=Paenibacillus sp. S-12 TaxID=3031371 RepID=UPI0025A1FDC9|nr:helix-turn-helix transcriptional regulator [Paenibacillus sp. S-12]